MKKHYIFFDIDLTCIADIYPFSEQYRLINYMFESDPKKKKEKKTIMIKNLENYMKNGNLLRPNMKNFIKACQKNIPNVHFYFYTGGAKEWADIIVNSIEKALDIQFERPIFHRKYTRTTKKRYYKSLLLIKPFIEKNSDPDEWLKRCIMLDDFPMILKTKKENERVIHTYNYEYTIPYDPLSIINKSDIEPYKKGLFLYISKFYPSYIDQDKDNDFDYKIVYHMKNKQQKEKYINDNLQNSEKIIKTFLENESKKQQKMIKNIHNKNDTMFEELTKLLFDPLEKNDKNDSDKVDALDEVFSKENLLKISKEFAYIGCVLNYKL